MLVFTKQGRVLIPHFKYFKSKFCQGLGFANRSAFPDKILPLPKANQGSSRWDKTANQFRQIKTYRAVIHDIKDPSETVRAVTLKIDEPGLTFNAGQWVDFFIPSVETVAGFSMTSAPYLAEDHGMLELAVKYSSYPPTHWIHHECEIGANVFIRVAGEFFYDPQPGNKSSTADLLLIGGGVGINPMASIAQHYVHTLQKPSKTNSTKLGRLKLLYSAKSTKELVLKDLFEELENQTETMSCHFFVTQATNERLSSKYSRKRILEEDVKLALKDFSSTNVVCYICGPISMIEEMEVLLLRLGIEKENIKYEKWV